MAHCTEMPQASQSTRGPIRWRHYLLPVGIALVGFVLNIVVATSMALTPDEDDHVAYGISILEGSTARPGPFFDSKMPVSALNAVPRGMSKFLRKRGAATSLAELLRDFRTSRYPTIVGTLLLCLLVYLFTEALFGRIAALFAQLMFVISPNIIAHGTLATTDLFLALTVVLFLYCLHRFLLHPSSMNAALAASALGLAQLSKLTALYLYPVLFVVVVSVLLYARFRPEQSPRITIRQVATLGVLTVVCSLVLINAGFLFERTFTPLARYNFQSKGFLKLQRIPVLREVPLPIPYAYLQGMDMVSYHSSTGLNVPNIVLLDEVRGRELPRFDGFPSYYLIAYTLKQPLGLQILFLLGLLWVVRHRTPGAFLTGEWMLLVTAAVFLVMLSFFSNIQIGIRHILPVLVIFVILSGGAFAAWLDTSRKQRLLLACCLAWAAISVGSYFPHMIPYFNEIVLDRKMTFHYLADSNLDWGQGRWLQDEFLKNNPDVVANPPHPTSGRILVRANWLAGLAKADYWLRQTSYRPVAHVGYANFLFDIPPQK